MTSPERLMTREEVANAASVEPQAVSNWASRDPDFPSAGGSGLPKVYSALAVAEWLDRRPISRNALLSGERQGRTYGERFRAAVGLPTSSKLGEAAAAPAEDPLDERLWIPVS